MATRRTRRAQARPGDSTMPVAPARGHPTSRGKLASTSMSKRGTVNTDSSPTSTLTSEGGRSNEPSPPAKKRRKITPAESSAARISSRSAFFSAFMESLNGPDGRKPWDPTALNDCLKGDPEFRPLPGIAAMEHHQLPKSSSATKTQPTSSRTLVASDSELSDLSDEEEGRDNAGPSKAFKQTALPLSMQNKDYAPLLVKSRRNWTHAYLVNFKAVTMEERRAGKGGSDEWEVVLHPAEGQKGTRTIKRPGDIMYLDDKRLADCTMPRISSVARKFQCDAKTRATSPFECDTLSSNSPRTGLPPPAEFVSMSRTAQLRHLRPHLQTLIQEQYSPAQQRIDAFFDARRRNTRLLGAGFQFGDIAQDEVDQVIRPELERWALRGCQPISESNTEEPNDTPGGSDRYNSLSPSEKKEYVFQVLLPEVVIRLCIASTELDQDQDQDQPFDLQAEYDNAKIRLDELALENESKRWQLIVDTVQAARASMRRKLGLPEENESEYDERTRRLAEKDKEVNWFKPEGRVRAKVYYYEGEGKQRVLWRPQT